MCLSDRVAEKQKKKLYIKLSRILHEKIFHFKMLSVTQHFILISVGFIFFLLLVTHTKYTKKNFFSLMYRFRITKRFNKNRSTGSGFSNAVRKSWITEWTN